MGLTVKEPEVEIVDQKLDAAVMGLKKVLVVCLKLVVVGVVVGSGAQTSRNVKMIYFIL
jgi:hypothetical protein